LNSIPFLIRYAKPCISPGRAGSTQYSYDTDADMVRWIADPSSPFAIDASDESGPMTKKADIEKGEDAKDRRMWR